MANNNKFPQIILNYKDLPALVKNYRKQKKSIVLTQGSFDVIHIGHGRYCQEAKSYGDVLFVGVDNDRKVQHRKGENRPIVPQEERLEMLTYLRSVDHAVLKPLSAPKWELIRILKPDFLIATDQTYSDQDIKKLEKICGKVIVLKPMATTSTSAKIRHVQTGMAKQMSAVLSQKLIDAIEEVLEEIKAQKR